MKETGEMNVHIQTGLELTTLLKLSWVKTRSSWTQSQHLHLDYWSRSWGTAWFLFRLLREMLLNFPSREGRKDHPSVRCLKIRLLSRFGGVYTKDLADKNTITPEKNRAHPFFPSHRCGGVKERKQWGKTAAHPRLRAAPAHARIRGDDVRARRLSRGSARERGKGPPSLGVLSCPPRLPHCLPDNLSSPERQD